MADNKIKINETFNGVHLRGEVRWGRRWWSEEKREKFSGKKKIIEWKKAISAREYEDEAEHKAQEEDENRQTAAKARVLWKWNSNSIASSSRFCGPIVIRAAHTSYKSTKTWVGRKKKWAWVKTHNTAQEGRGGGGQRRKEKRNILNASHVQRRYLACWL